MSPRQGFFVEHYDKKLDHTCQVWLRFQTNGEVQNNWCVWQRAYRRESAGEVRGQQEAFLLLFRQIAHTLNSGVEFQSILEALNETSWLEFPAISLPEPWFYWASAFDYDSADETAPVCTHYFVQPRSDQCLVWQEDTYIEVVPCDSVGINWQAVEEAINSEFDEYEEEVVNAEEEDREG